MVVVLAGGLIRKMTAVIKFDAYQLGRTNERDNFHTD